jgi:hypothetical protein
MEVMKSGTKLIFGAFLLVVFLIATGGWLLMCLGANAERGMPNLPQLIMGFFAIDVGGPILLFLGVACAGFLLARSGWRDLRWKAQERKNPEPMGEPNEASQPIAAKRGSG